jgi:ATP:ADP antiporter, AAA family
MQSILRALNIDSSEAGKVSILLLLSFFLGVFVGTYDVSANTLFLEAYSKKDFPVAFTISGVVGILLTMLFTRLQSKISFSALVNGTMFTSAIIVGLLRLGIYISPNPWLIYTAFILFGPLNVVLIVAFWGIAGRLFTLRQGKRLFGLVDSGKILAAAIACFSIPLIIKLIMGAANLLVISTISLLFATALSIIINKKYNLENIHEQDAEGTSEKSAGGLAFVNDHFCCIIHATRFFCSLFIYGNYG